MGKVRLSHVGKWCSIPKSAINSATSKQKKKRVKISCHRYFQTISMMQLLQKRLIYNFYLIQLQCSGHFGRLSGSIKIFLALCNTPLAEITKRNGFLVASPTFYRNFDKHSCHKYHFLLSPVPYCTVRRQMAWHWIATTEYNKLL